MCLYQGPSQKCLFFWSIDLMYWNGYTTAVAAGTDLGFKVKKKKKTKRHPSLSQQPGKPRKRIKKRITNISLKSKF